jgi:hypothetical protein
VINIKDLEKRDVGHWVTYTLSTGKQETGRIKSWNDKFIFVVYKCADEWDKFKDYTGVATNPKDLVAL